MSLYIEPAQFNEIINNKKKANITLNWKPYPGSHFYILYKMVIDQDSNPDPNKQDSQYEYVWSGSEITHTLQNVENLDNTIFIIFAAKYVPDFVPDIPTK